MNKPNFKLQCEAIKKSIRQHPSTDEKKKKKREKEKKYRSHMSYFYDRIRRLGQLF